jgi:hypothetical protein
MSMGNLLSVVNVHTTMATNQSTQTTGDSGIDPSQREPVGIDHLTVVPENADSRE